MNRWRSNPWAALLVLSAGFFMTLLDLTIVNIAIPNMSERLGASIDEVLWVLNAYTLALAVLLITSGRLGDLRGPRPMFSAGVALFTLASLACGISQEPWQLIAARAVQGVGAAMLIPQTLTIITTTFPPERRGAAFGVWGAVAGVATIAGPTFGGLLVTAFDWRWIFFINLPIGLAVLALTPVIVPDPRPGRRAPLDLPGVVLASVALFLLTWGLIQGERYKWGPGILASLLAGLILLGVFFWLQAGRQDQQPLVPFGLFRERNYALMIGVGAAVSIGMIGIFFPLTIYLQAVLGMSAVEAGLTIAPSSVVPMFLAPLAGRLSDRIGGKFILFGGLLLYALGMGMVALSADVDSTWRTFLPGLIVAGVGVGGVFAPMATVAMRNVSTPMAGAASGVMNTSRQLGAVLAGAVVGAVLQNRLSASLTDVAARHAAQVPEAFRERFLSGFRNAAGSGLEVGPPGGRPPGVPAGAGQLGALARQVFAEAFVPAFQFTVGVPIAVVAVAALACLWIRRDRGRDAGTPERTEPSAVTSPP